MIDKHVLFPEDLWLAAEEAASKRTQRLREKHSASDIIRAGLEAEIERELNVGQSLRRRSSDRKVANGNG